jgi:hypothetical protein
MYSITGCTLTLFEEAKRIDGQQMMWLCNRDLDNGIRIKVACVILYNTVRIAIHRNKERDLIYKEFAKEYPGFVTDFNQYADYMSQVEDEHKNESMNAEELRNFMGCYAGYWIGWSIQQEYKKNNEHFEFSDEFLSQIGLLVITYALEISIPLIE